MSENSSGALEFGLEITLCVDLCLNIKAGCINLDFSSVRGFVPQGSSLHCLGGCEHTQLLHRST